MKSNKQFIFLHIVDFSVTQVPTQWIPGALFPMGRDCQSVNLTTAKVESVWCFMSIPPHCMSHKT